MIESLTLWLQSLPFTFLPGLLLFLMLPLAFVVLLLRRQRLDVGSLLLFRDLPQRTLFQNINLEHLWHRWIYVFIFAVLALIAAGLSLPQPGQRHVIVLDDSASMAAWIDPLDQDRGRVWDQAKARARVVAEQSSALGRAVVLLRLTDFSPINGASGDEAKALEELLENNEISGQLSALNDAALSILPLNHEERLQSLGSLAGGQGVGRITVITDRPLGDNINFDDQVDWIDVGQSTPPINLAIVGVEEKQNTFDRDTRVVIQNLSNVPVSGAQLIMRSIKNPVSLPLVGGLALAPNERIELELDSLRERAEVLGSGPLLLSVEHPADSLDVDNSIWTVRPTNEKMAVALVRCLGTAPLFDRLEGVPGIDFSYFGDITALDLSGTLDDEAPAETDGEEMFSLGGEIDAAGGQFESFDLVIYDRCELPPLYEELETNSIVIEAVINEGSDPNAIDEAAAAAVLRVGWQAPSSRSPVLSGVRSLVGMPLPSQSVRPLPQTHGVVGLFSDLDPNMVAGTADQDFFAPTDLLQGFVAFDGMTSLYDPETDTETAQAADPDAPKMLYLGFDPHIACLDDVVNERPQSLPLAEALAASQNGPDDCLALGLMMVNAIEWMRAASLEGDNAGARVQRIRQYFSTGESLSVQSAAAAASDQNAEAVQPRERLYDIAIVDGQSGSERNELTPLVVDGLADVSAGDNSKGDRVRWLLDAPGLREYSGTRLPFQLSVGLLNADESRMTREPFLADIDMRGASASAGRQDLVRLLVFVLLGLMLIEVLILLFRGRGVFVRHTLVTNPSSVKAGGEQ